MLAADLNARRYFLYRPSSSEAQALVERSLKPAFPAVARYVYSVGSVDLNLIVDANGNVQKARLLDGPLAFQQPTLAALEQWNFKPLLLGGQRTPWTARVRATFKSSAPEATVIFLDAAAR